VDLRCSTSTIGGQIVVALAGIADLSTAPVLQSHLRQTVSDHAGRRLMVDLDGLGLLDDVALGLLLGAAARARELGGDLDLVCSRPRLRERLSTTRFDQVVDVRTSIADRTPT
jgi:anti-sigma B factor antagonist